MIMEILLGVLVVLNGGIVYYAYRKLNNLDTLFYGMAKNFFNEISTNEGLQKNIYTLGALIGNGAISGAGINKPSSGKFKLQDVIGQVIGQFIQSKISLPGTPGEQPTQNIKANNQVSNNRGY